MHIPNFQGRRGLGERDDADIGQHECGPFTDWGDLSALHCAALRWFTVHLHETKSSRQEPFFMGLNHVLTISIYLQRIQTECSSTPSSREGWARNPGKGAIQVFEGRYDVCSGRHDPTVLVKEESTTLIKKEGAVYEEGWFDQ